MSKRLTPDKKQKNGRGAISHEFEKLLNYNVVLIKRKGSRYVDGGDLAAFAESGRAVF
ncbi:hypothetical protein [Neisseria sp.]|uniref:hypothetical protein n=1 Tax=Neisseria sp. TaxID=192066 RepID=UPI0028A0DF87|nr:hypothetical protein [Neisseria sp.]